MSDHLENRFSLRHGGDLALATARYGAPAAGWLDLSTGINPFPYPVPPLSPDTLAHLPDRAALARLLAAARDAYAVPSGIDLVATPGTEIAIRLLPYVAPPGRVAIVGPTYGSHGEAWAAAGHETVDVDACDAVPTGTAIAVVGNPNNPDGRIPSRTDLVALARRVSLLVIDEAFADVVPEASFMPRAADAPVVVLRSFGKFYGLAGVRLGFVAGPPALTGRLSTLLGGWPISGAAIAIGEAALRDREWRERTRTHLRAESEALRRLLIDHGMGVVGGTDLFVLTESDEAAIIHQALAERGIWTRAFANRPRWLRFGLPCHGGLDRLAGALREIR